MTTTILSLFLIGAVGAEVETKTERETFLYITTKPAGADVLVNGKRVGTTPGLFPFNPGVHRQVIVDLEGHEQHKEGITIRAGDIKRLKLRLKRRTEAEMSNRVLGTDGGKAPGADLENSRKGPAVAGMTGTISGRVLGIEDVPISGAIVVLLDQKTGSPLVKETYQSMHDENLAKAFTEHTRIERIMGMSAYAATDANGRFSFQRVPAGEYRLLAHSYEQDVPPGECDDVHMRGTADHLRVDPGGLADVVLRPLGTGVLRIDDNVQKRGLAIALSTAPFRADLMSGVAEWGKEFRCKIIGIHLKQPGTTTIRGVPAGIVHVVEFDISGPSGLGLGQAVARVKPGTVTELHVPVHSNWMEVINAERGTDRTPGRDETPASLNEALGLIERDYFLGVDRPKLIEAAVEGMVNDLGEHSAYIDPDELHALKQQSAEKLSGVGLSLGFDQSTGEVLVETPLPDTPAHRAGIRAGDTIVQIDGKPVSDFPKGKVLQAAAMQIRGRPGSSVVVGLRDAATGEVQQITLVRELLHLPAIKGDRRKPDGTWEFMLDDNLKIGYIRLPDFGPECAHALTKALRELRSRGMKALVIDLRNNPGGSLSQAIRVADLFVDEGTIVSVKSREDPGETWFANKEGTFSEPPMAVLVNRDSAGAAEIVAACLQDHRRALVVGERTYGKGTAHRILELKVVDGALKLPAAVFLRPSGKNIHRFEGAQESDIWGVAPDETCEITLPEGEYEAFLEYRRQQDLLGADRAVSSFVDRQLELAVERLGRSLSNQ